MLAIIHLIDWGAPLGAMIDVTKPARHAVRAIPAVACGYDPLRAGAAHIGLCKLCVR
jgi:hypothetical protein